MRRAVLKQFSLIFYVDHSIAVLLGKEIEEWRMIIDGTSYKCKLNCMCLSVVHSLYACVCLFVCVYISAVHFTEFVLSLLYNRLQ